MKSLPSDDSHLKLQYAFAIGFELGQGARKIATIITSRWFKCTIIELKTSAQSGQPAVDDELYARVIDLLNTDYNYLDLVPKGRDKGGRGPSGCAGTPNTRRRPRSVGSCCD